MRRLHVALALITILALGLLTGCIAVPATPAAPAVATPEPTATPVPQPKLGGTLRFVPQGDLKTLDPIWTTAYVTRNYAYAIFDTLVAWDAENQAKPQMVQEWQVSQDSRQWRFTLRDGLAFHDGRPVTAQNAVASLKRWGQMDALGKLLFAATDKLEANDSRTFTLTLKEPFGMVLDAIGKPSSLVPVVMTAEDAAKPGDQAAEAKIGSGPYKLLEWRPGDRVSLVRNEKYTPRSEPASGLAGGKRVYLDRLDWIIVPDKATQLAGVETGEYDILEFPSNDDYERLRKNPNIQTFIVPLGHQAWLRFNMVQPPFDNVLARRAVQAGADQERYLRAAYGPSELWRKCPALFVCGGPWETAVGSEELTTVNLEKGKRLLKESGYDGRAVVVIAPTDFPDSYNASLVTKELFESLGMKVDFQAMDWASVVGRRAKKDPPSAGGWNAFHTAVVFFDASNPAVHFGIGPTWFGWYNSPRMEELRAQWVRAVDVAEKKRLVEEIQRLYYQDVPFLNIGQALTLRAAGKQVKGIINHPVPIPWNIWLER